MTVRDEVSTYNFLDFVKFCMAICVIAIHSYILDEISSPGLHRAVDLIIRMSVPFFFMSSSFLLFRKLNGMETQEKCTKIKTYTLKMAKLYVIWTAIYGPITIFYFVYTKTPLLFAIKDFLFGFLLYGQNHMSWPLWYLLSTVYSMIVIYLQVKAKWKDWQILLVSILVYGASILIGFLTETADNYSGLMSYAVKLLYLLFINGRILTGLMYLVIGMCIANHSKLQRIPWYVSVIVFVVSFGITFLWDNEITKQIMYISFFLSVLSVRLPDRSCFKWFRETSTVLYFVHMYFVFLLSQLFIPVYNRCFLKFFIVCVCSLGLACVIIALRKKHGRKFLAIFG